MDIIARRLVTIQTEIRQVKQRKLQCEQMLGLFLEHPPALNPEDVGRRMQFLRDQIRSLENQKRALLEEEKDLIVRAATLGILVLPLDKTESIIYLRNLKSLSLLQLVPVRLFGMGQAAHIHEEKNREGVILRIISLIGISNRPRIEKGWE
ncbi:hypothetical protein Tco_1349251 [Tanacetum coccineum]